LSERAGQRPPRAKSVKRAKALGPGAARVWADYTSRIKEVATRFDDAASAVAAEPISASKLGELCGISAEWHRLVRGCGELAAAATQAATDDPMREVWRKREQEVERYAQLRRGAWREQLHTTLSRTLMHLRAVRATDKRATQPVGMVLQLRRELGLDGETDRRVLAEIKPAGYYRHGTMLFFNRRKGTGAVRPNGPGATATVTAASFVDGEPFERGMEVAYYERPGRPRPRASVVRAIAAGHSPIGSGRANAERAPTRGVTSVVSGGGGPGTGRRR
jgi:hypothetical protein